MSCEADKKYITRVLEGDLQAYAYLVDAYKNMAFNIALKLTRNTEDAEDAVQESFIKAYNKLHTFNHEAKFSTWLYSIVYRTTAYNLRKNKIATESIVNQDFSTETTDALTEDEKKYFIASAIDKLPKVESLLVTLFYLNENSIEEIEAITGLSKSNIKVKLFRARKKLKGTLSSLLKDEVKSLLS